MKKLLIIAGGLAAMSLSMNAAAGTISGSTTGATSTVTSASDCQLLSENVTINLSKQVSAGYACNTTSNVLAFAACHANGRKSGTNNYIFYGASDGGSVTADTNSGACSAANAQTVAQAHDS